MPERTVDAWVASAICTAFPAARIWDPTQAIKGGNWDCSFSLLGDGKVFLFEDKGTTPVIRKLKAPLQTHKIDINRNQLDWYCDEVDPGGAPVHYVLPKPPWTGSVSHAYVPEQAASRVTSLKGPFLQWAYVIRCTDLRTQLGTRASLDTHELPLEGAITLAEFFKDVRQGKSGRRVRTEEAAHAFETDRQGDPKPLNRRDLNAGSAFAVFVPAENLDA
jgi:hypothetical protein